MSADRLSREYAILGEKLAERGIEIDAIKKAAMTLHVETPSWGYGNSGTRFKVFHEKGIPRDTFEKFEDAGVVHKLTGIAPSVAVHIPWDKVDDYTKLRNHAEAHGVAIGAVNPNLFQEYDYKHGSLAHVNREVRRRSIDHMKECVDIAVEVGSNLFTPWFADGTNYPGQGNFRKRRAWFDEGLAEVYHHMPNTMRMLVEYKFFEPAFYHTDVADWGVSYAICKKLGDRAQVLVDTGHHAQGTNIEWIVATLIYEGRMGGFHFNNRKYADDDLTVGSINPYEMFLIYNELVAAEQDPDVPKLDVAYMLDQSHIIKRKVEAAIQSVMSVQDGFTKAFLVERDKLEAAREVNDTLMAETTLQRAFNTDVSPILQTARVEAGLHPDPIAAYRESGYQEKIEAERVGDAAGWS